jgi:hypothetical protein
LKIRTQWLVFAALRSDSNVANGFVKTNPTTDSSTLAPDAIGPV